MNRAKLLPVIAVILFTVILIAGCTQPATPPATKTPTATATPTVPATTTVVPTPTPVKFVYNESANGTTANLPLGTTFMVRLDENPTTGYTWNVSVTGGLNITDDNFIAPTSGLAGAGGVHTWNVLTVKNGTQKFSGIYMRSWENVTPEDTTYSLNINVTG